MKINKLISKYNFNPGQLSRIKYIVIHYVGSNGTAKANAEFFSKGNRNSSAHYFVGHDGDIWQSVEDQNIAWHCGAKTYKHPECRNANSIGIEMCCKYDSKWYLEDATVNAAIELTKVLMSKYKIPVSNVIRHYDVTGKNCPAPYVQNNTKHKWNEFKNAISGGKPMNNDKHIWDFLKKSGFTDIAAAGIMGNLYAESGLQSTNLQNSFNKKFNLTDETYTSGVDNGTYSKQLFTTDKAGYGLAQWTFWSRKRALYDFAKKKGTSIGDLDMQLEFLLNDIKSRGDMFDRLNAATSVVEASNIILHEFEKPADQSSAVESKRAEYGIKYYFEFFSKSPVVEVAQSPVASAPVAVPETTNDFRVRVENSFLNIRTGPGTNYDKVGQYINVGVYTIVEKKDGQGSKSGWGKLKSGAGWISLDYVTRV